MTKPQDQSALARLQPFITVAGIAIIMLALVAILAASFVTNRTSNTAVDRLTNEVNPLTTELERAQLAALSLGLESRGYALTGDSVARGRVARAEAEYRTAISEYRSLARVAARENEAGRVADATDAYVAMSVRIAQARAAGNILESARLVNVEATPLLAAMSEVAADERAALDAELDRLTDDVEAAERREHLVLGLATGAGFVVALILIWLAVYNRRLQAEAGRERSRLAAVVADVPGIVWEAWGQPDAATQRIDFVSNHVESMLGYTTAEWLETPNFWLSIVHPDDRERAGAEGAAIFASGDGGTSQFRWLTKDGRAIDVLAISSVILDASGTPLGMRGVTLDISERTRAEEALAFTAKASEVLFAPLGEENVLSNVAQLAVPGLADWCAIYLLDAAGEPRLAVVRHVDAQRTQAARELMERFPPNPDLPGGMYEVMRTGQPAFLSEIPQDQLQAAARTDERLRAMLDAGFRSYIAAPMIARGRTIGVLALISAESRRRYEQRDADLACDLALRAAIAVENQRLFDVTRRERARFESIVSSIADGVYQVDEAMRLVHMNPAAAHMLGYDAEELVGRDIHDILHPLRADGTPNPREECAMWRAINENAPVRRNDRFRRTDGGVIDIELNASPIELEGHVIGAVGVFQDIGARLEQERMKDDFLAFASHELRSPLTTVSGFSKWLTRQIASGNARVDPQVREAIEALDEGTDRMADIVELFLDLTRIESNRLLVELEPVRLDMLVADEAERAAARHPHADIALKPGVGRVLSETDERRLRQVVSNLLDNAVKYGGDPPVVRVELEQRDGSLAICVRDNGRGIPEADQPHVFERFFRGAADSTSARSGLGIGLFVSKQIVEKLGGEITFQTGGEGTEFVVMLPLIEASELA